MELSKVKIGETFPIAGIEFTKFADKDGITVAVAKECVFSSAYGKNNNLAESDILNRLNKDILPKLEEAIGAENIKEFELDLTSLDGLDTYGKIKTRIGIPTFDFYRQNVRIFDKYLLDDWWWTATPDTTNEHYDGRWVTCVSPRGIIYDDFYYGNRGVRPFLHFVSSISVSCEE